MNRYEFSRVRDIIKELSENTIIKEDCDDPEYIQELWSEADELVSKMEKEYAAMVLKMIEPG
jgi:hypothetical protein